MAKNILPAHSKKYFWDTDFKKIDPQKNSVFLTERLIDMGDLEQINWLKNTYGIKFLKEIIKKSRRISPKTANFFAIYFGIDPKNILCLQKDYRQQHKAIWYH